MILSLLVSFDVNCMHCAAPSPKEIKGLEWQGAAIGTAAWGGVLLRDVLLAAGLDDADSNVKHIQVWYRCIYVVICHV